MKTWMNFFKKKQKPLRMVHLYDLSVVLPMYQSKQGWELQLIDNIKTINKQLGDATVIEFIVVNDGGEIEQLSNLFDVVRDSHPNIKFISYNGNMGKGFALRTGVAAASAPHIITTDLDFPYQIEDLKKVFLLLKAGEDIVVGRRNPTYYASIPFRRKVISKACNALNRYVLKLPFADAQSGLKGFNKAGRNLFLRTTIDRFLVDTEFLVLAHRLQYPIKVVDINLKSGIRFSSMGWKILATEGKNFYRILRMNKGKISPQKVIVYEQQASVANV
jgi:glycosyltransferase involved in cell wall biosynthesis